MAALEKRHGTLNSTHDASLDDLSEVTIPNFRLENILIFFCLTNFKHFLIVKLRLFPSSSHQQSARDQTFLYLLIQADFCQIPYDRREKERENNFT